MKKITFFSVLLFIGVQLFAQVGINTTSPDPSSELDISSTDGGILIPRMTQTDRNLIASPAMGLMIYQTDNTPGFYYFDGSSWVIIGGGVDTQNTLDEAYDEGGAGLGRTIVADNGAISIQGNDGLEVTGTFGTGSTIGPSGAGTRMFFNPRKAAFRAGNVTATQWNDANVGDYSVAMGRATTASGTYDVAIGFGSLATGSYSTALGWANRASGAYSVSIGQNSTASGWSSTALGRVSTASGSESMVFGHDSSISGTRAIGIGSYLESPSGYEITMGHFNTLYTPTSTVGIDPSDRLFSIGNGTSGAARSNALTIYKDGTLNINDSYNMPLTDGTSGQVMTTDGAGNLTFQTPATGAERINDLIDGKSDNDGTQDGSSIFLGINAGAVDDLSNNSNVGIGFNALEDNIDGALNVAIGWRSLAENLGDNNTAMGYLSAGGNTTGNGNTAIGRNALVSNGTSNYNTALGFYAGWLNTGSGNLFLGANAGFNHSTTSNKLYIENSDAGPDEALIYGDFGTDNTTTGNILRTNSEFQIGNPTGTGYAFPTTDGTASQVLTTDGAGNLTFQTPTTGAERINDLIDGKSDNDGTQDGSSVFLGVNAGATDDSSDNQNVGIGFNALTTNFAGYGNVAIGYNSMIANFGWNNTAIGTHALEGLTSGFYNVALGPHTMPNLTTGSDNTIIGFQAGSNATNSSGNVFLGSEAGAFASGGNQLFIENSAANEDSALIYGEFGLDSTTSGNILRTNSEFQIGNPTGTGYAFPTTDGSNGQVLTTDGAGQVSFTTLSLTDTQNTLDEAYDEGGAGAGRTITADNGAVTIDGVDGFMVTGGYGAGDIVSVTGVGTRMFFNPNKAAFRAGSVGSGGIFDSTAWDDANIGSRSFAVNIGTIASGTYSFASGVSTEASGYASTAMGYVSEASGWYSTAMGEATIASGWGEMAVGSYNSTGTSRVFVVGNGTSDVNRSNAFEVFDSGLITFNEEYTFPLTDGSANQVLRTNGAGTLTWATVNSESTTASNGLTETGNDVQLGGTLSQNTTITQGNFDLSITSSGTGGVSILNSGTSDSGLIINKSDNATTNQYGIYVSKASTNSSADYGLLNELSGSGAGAQYATYNNLTTTGSGSKYGVYNNFDTATPATKYGVWNEFVSSSGNYFGITNNMTGATSQAVFGVNNVLSGTGTGAKTGISNSFSGANGNVNIYIGMDNSFNDTGNGDRWGVRNNMDGTGTGTHYGSFNDLTGTGSGPKYGTYNYIDSGAGGTHYGTYNEVDIGNGWAGYFVGKNYVSGAIGINNPTPDGRLDIIHNSTSETSPHIMVTAQNANSGSRITFDNAAETANNWVLFARADDTPGTGVLNFYSSEITSNVLRLESDGKVGIMRNPATNALEVEGDASKTTAGSWAANSDRRLKKEINSISGETALDKIEKMRGVTYLWDDDKTGAKRPEGLQYGFIAQELMEVFPEKVTKDNLGFYQTAYGDYDPLFVEAIKELKSEVETLSEENAKLKEQLSKMEKLDARLSALEKNNSSSNTSEMISEKKK